MILLADGLTGDSRTKIIDGLLDVLVLTWPVLVIVGVLASLPLIVRVFRYRRLARSGIKDIDRFGGRTFEEYLAVLFKRLGYKVERTKFVGDYGGDLVLRKDGIRTVVQAKRYSKSVGVKAVQEVVAAKGYYDCDQSMVVSNSHYTKQARELARKNDVELWDRDMLIRQLTATGAKQAAHRNGAAEAGSVTGTSATDTTPTPSASPAQPLATVATCRRCAKVLSSGERTYCESNAQRFGGQMLCFRHQRTRRATRPN